MAASCSIRQTVLRLIVLPNVACDRLPRSASDCLLRGSSVSAMTSHARAWINARSSGGKSGLAPTSRLIDNRKVAAGPTSSPTPHLSWRQANSSGSFLGFAGWLLMKKQYQTITLNDLHRSSASPRRVACILHEIVGEGTTSGQRTWHSGFPSLPGVFWGFTSCYQKSILTRTLFVERTT